MADNNLSPADKPSASSAMSSQQIDPPQLTPASLDLSPLDNIQFLPLLPPGPNYRRNFLSRQKFRKLRRLSRLSLTPALQKFRAATLANETGLPSFHLSAKPKFPPPLVNPTLTMRILLSIAN